MGDIVHPSGSKTGHDRVTWPVSLRFVCPATASSPSFRPVHRFSELDPGKEMRSFVFTAFPYVGIAVAIDSVMCGAPHMAAKFRVREIKQKFDYLGGGEFARCNFVSGFRGISCLTLFFHNKEVTQRKGWSVSGRPRHIRRLTLAHSLGRGRA